MKNFIAISPIYREIYTQVNFCKSRKFGQIAKLIFAKFNNVGVACRANKRDREMFLFYVLRCFNPEEKQENPFLPDSTGPLSIVHVVPSSTTEAANKALKRVLFRRRRMQLYSQDNSWLV